MSSKKKPFAKERKLTKQASVLGAAIVAGFVLLTTDRLVWLAVITVALIQLSVRHRDQLRASEPGQAITWIVTAAFGAVFVALAAPQPLVVLAALALGWHLWAPAKARSKYGPKRRPAPRPDPAAAPASPTSAGTGRGSHLRAV